MSLANNKTTLLWQSFMPNLQQIQHRVSKELVSMSVYNTPMEPGNFHQIFDKWAAVEVNKIEEIPNDMEVFELAGGIYAVFHYSGPDTDSSIFEYIFTGWLPSSQYMLDQRPFFEILGDKYKRNAPESEEDIYIPITTTSG